MVTIQTEWRLDIDCRSALRYVDDLDGRDGIRNWFSRLAEGLDMTFDCFAYVLDGFVTRLSIEEPTIGSARLPYSRTSNKRGSVSIRPLEV